MAQLGAEAGIVGAGDLARYRDDLGPGMQREHQRPAALL
jgi:hypothetical protein